MYKVEPHILFSWNTLCLKITPDFTMFRRVNSTESQFDIETAAAAAVGCVSLFSFKSCLSLHKLNQTRPNMPRKSLLIGFCLCNLRHTFIFIQLLRIALYILLVYQLSFLFHSSFRNPFFRPCLTHSRMQACIWNFQEQFFWIFAFGRTPHRPPAHLCWFITCKTWSFFSPLRQDKRSGRNVFDQWARAMFLARTGERDRTASIFVAVADGIKDISNGGGGVGTSTSSVCECVCVCVCVCFCVCVCVCVCDQT